ncbi:MAG TPA: MFS transporter, partial [Phenylobacterium sp.]|nr:MFS transporter [Phenylobacterium sp.]
GLTAMLEALSTGLVTGAAGIVLKPVRLRMIAVIAAAILVVLDLATTRTSGESVMVVRALAGLPEGILLWISIGFISRTVTPERWAAVLFTGMGLTQLSVATGLSALVLPRFGADGGYVTVAVGAALAIPVALFLPRSLGAVAAAGAETSGAPPFRGWVALAGTLCMAASLTAVAVYVIPLARQAGLSVAVGRTAISVGLACQMAGGGLATLLAGRIRYITVFWVCAAVFLATWGAFAVHAPAWLFIAMTGLSGLAAFMAGPFLVPMTVEADPSRRAAMQSGAVQLLAGAFGPLLASQAVTDHNVHGVLILAVVLQGVGLTVATRLHHTARAERIAA